ncbi:MAG TPA: NADP-dependent phosphogluconate dehydrogenase [Pseudomonadales bacterium]
MTAATANLGLIGLGAMGRNLGWRLAELHIPLAVYSYDAAEIERFNAGLAVSVPAAADPADLVRRLASPRAVLLMVTAGAAVDRVIDDLLPGLEPGDLIIDAGNSHFRDTLQRAARLGADRIGYVGAGISGGAEGARRGASIMVGADERDWARSRPVLEALAARVDGSVCAARVGPQGAGHFVKMVHNGIEYALMQLIAESWQAMEHVLRWDRQRQREAFDRFNRGPVSSFLVGITTEILAYRDPEDDTFLLDRVSDRAAQKGTGRWTVEAALALGVPVPTIAAAVSERLISASRRPSAARSERLPVARVTLRPEAIEGALFAGFVSSFGQGFALLAAASDAYGWQLDLAEVARIWQGGCIIRADLLRDVEAAYQANPAGTSLVDVDPLRSALLAVEPQWREFVACSVAAGITAPCSSAALAWHDSLRAARLPTSLIQAQRDRFGAHGFARTDREGEFHAPWKQP